MDFCAWSLLEIEVSASHASVDTLKKFFERAWDKIPQKMFRNSIENFICRLEAIIQARGGEAHWKIMFLIIL